MTYFNLRDYHYTKFHSELEDTGDRHYQAVTRDVETVIRDEYAADIVQVEYPVIYEQDLEGWARSFYTLEGHMEAILAYSAPETHITAFDLDKFADSIQAVQNELSSLPITRAFDVLTELDQVKYEHSSAAGYSYRGHKGPRYGDNHTRAIERAKATLWSTIRDRTQGPEYMIENSVPDVGYTRTQLTDLTEKTKVRGVWGRSFHYILLEGTAARPLLENFISGNTFFHIGDDPLTSVPRVLSSVSSKCRWIYALDWKSFDSSVSRLEIDTAFNILRDRILFPNQETELTYDLCRLLFLHKKIAAPDGRIYWIHRGIPSGSYYTSLIGSIVNRLRIEYLWRLKYNRGPKMCYTQGDDSLIGDDELFDPDEMADLVSHLGWKINPEKTEHSTAPEFVTFLGRTIRGSSNVRDLKRCLRLLVYPEYPVENGRIAAYRAKSIAEDCGGISEIINLVARRLKRTYGVAKDEEVPLYFKKYEP